MNKPANKAALPHKNRQYHNWLAYKIGDRFLRSYTHLYKGDLYDLGCGEAPFKSFFLQYADKYIGVDWSATQHDASADIVADLNKQLAMESGIADTIISMSVMEHLCEPQTMLNEAFRILRPGGNLVLQVPWQWWIHEAPHDYFRYTPYALRMMLQKAGFEDVDVVPQSGFFTMFFLKFNYFTKRYVRGPRWLRALLMVLFVPVWFVLQICAPFLDRIDRKWESETIGYFVTARKHEPKK